MNAKKAFLNSIKYNAVALLPTVIGFGLILTGFYLLLGQPIVEIMDIMGQRELQWVIENDQTVLERVIQSSSYILAPAIMVFGYLFHRVGRTFLLFYIQGSSIESALTESESDSGSEDSSDSEDTN